MQIHRAGISRWKQGKQIDSVFSKKLCLKTRKEKQQWDKGADLIAFEHGKYFVSPSQKYSSLFSWPCMNLS